MSKDVSMDRQQGCYYWIRAPGNDRAEVALYRGEFWHACGWDCLGDDMGYEMPGVVVLSGPLEPPSPCTCEEIAAIFPTGAMP